MLFILQTVGNIIWGVNLSNVATCAMPASLVVDCQLSSARSWRSVRQQAGEEEEEAAGCREGTTTQHTHTVTTREEPSCLLIWHCERSSICWSLLQIFPENLFYCSDGNMPDNAKVIVKAQAKESCAVRPLKGCERFLFCFQRKNEINIFGFISHKWKSWVVWRPSLQT